MCEGMHLVECEPGFLNDGFSCLETDLSPIALAGFHQAIIEGVKSNKGRNADELYTAEFESRMKKKDFEAAVKFKNGYEITADREIRRFLWRFNRDNGLHFGIGSFTLTLITIVLLLILWKVLDHSV
jgi:hypothetical protein